MSADRLHIVIVEDEPDTAEMYAEMVRISGYEVIKYYGGIPAVEQITEIRPAAVILDIMMPDMSGLEVLRHIRGNPASSDIPVIIVSAKTLQSDIHEGLDAGANVYLTKPVSFKDLKNAIDRVINLRLTDSN